jgi:preprotein translocase subunit SecA
MSYLNENYRLTTIHKPGKIPKGIDARVYRFMGAFKGRRSELKKCLRASIIIDQKSLAHQNLSEERLRNELLVCREQFRRHGKQVNESIGDALALIQEAVMRVMGFRPFVEQLTGALMLYRGFVAEMSTGEGKTITAAMTAILRGWCGYPCHVITANDYLAARDAETLTPLFSFCHVSVGSVTSEMKPPERRAGYAKDVTYTTAGDVLADFLRDRISLGQLQSFERRVLMSLQEQGGQGMREIVMRGVHTAIVDEADNVLIDEAVTPLIISREEPNEAFMASCQAAIRIANELRRDLDYRTDETFRTVIFLKNIEELVEEYQKHHPSIFNGILFQKDLVRQALVAKEFFLRDRQYVIEDDKVVIVDESTGRKMPMRSWSSGLHQLIEAKENLPMTPVKETQARLSFQRYFRFYKSFSGMTGTGKEAASEFWIIYGLPVLTIPNHRPSKRKLAHLHVFATEADKWDAILEEIQIIHKRGRPILVGTRNVQKSEELALRIAQAGLHCKVVNAVRQKEEAEIIAMAGLHGAITVATNMAGRGTDIKIPAEVNLLGGLHVIATECHSSSRIDRQLFGRAARQGDHGSATPFTSMEDELLTRNLPKWIILTVKALLRRFPASAHLIGTVAVKLAQFRAHRKDYQSRMSVQRMDTWLDDALSFASDDVK